MSTEPELTPGERDDMRDLVLAGAQRITSRRRHRRQAYAALVAVVLVGGVISGVAATALMNDGRFAAPPTPTETTPTPTQSTTTPTPTPTPTPTESPISPDPATWIVSDAGIGPAKLGMPLAAVAATVPGVSQECVGAYQSPDGHLTMLNLHGTVGRPVELVMWRNGPGPRTAAGIGYGSTEAEVRAAYPDARQVTTIGLQPLIAGRVYFLFDEDGRVSSLGATTTDNLPYDWCDMK